MAGRSQLTRKLREWRDDPVAMVRELFGVDPDPQQKEILKAFPNHQRIGMKASKGTGKTTTLSWCSWNFMLTRPHPNVAATSITAENLSDGLWKEMAKWRNRSELLKKMFEWTKTRIFAKQHPETWFMSARTWPKQGDATQQADTLAGFHADYVMFVLDESGGIPSAVMATAEAGLASGIECKIMQAGNPTQLAGPLYDMCSKENHLWFYVELTGNPDDPNRSPRVSVQWAREQIEKYGRDNPWVLVNVFGRFPPSGLNQLLGPEDIRDSQNRTYRPEQYAWAPKVIGLDVAGETEDGRTVAFPRQGLMAFDPIVMRNAKSSEIAARIAAGVNKWNPQNPRGVFIFVDDTGGWAVGVIETLAAAGFNVIPVNFSGKATDPRYWNKRAEMYFCASQWVKDKRGSLPDDPEIVREAIASTYSFRNGKFIIEDKDQVKEKIQTSPDIWDAFVLTHAFDVASPDIPQVGSQFEGIRSVEGKCAVEYDPLEDVR